MGERQDPKSKLKSQILFHKNSSPEDVPSMTVTLTVLLLKDINYEIIYHKLR